MELPSAPITLVTTAISTLHIFLIKEAIVSLISSTATLQHLRFALSSQPKLSEEFSHEYLETMYSSGESSALPHFRAILKHILKFSSVTDTVIRHVTSAMGDSNVFVGGIRATLHQMAGDLRLEGSAFYPIIKPFKLLSSEFPQELRVMILQLYFAMPRDSPFLTSPLLLACNREFYATAKKEFEKVYYSVKFDNIKEFMQLPWTEASKIIHLRVAWESHRSWRVTGHPMG
jgi:hypothetical protein